LSYFFHSSKGLFLRYVPSSFWVISFVLSRVFPFVSSLPVFELFYSFFQGPFPSFRPFQF
jgi:hypothetical protein